MQERTNGVEVPPAVADKVLSQGLSLFGKGWLCEARGFCILLFNLCELPGFRAWPRIAGVPALSIRSSETCKTVIKSPKKSYGQLLGPLYSTQASWLRDLGL